MTADPTAPTPGRLDDPDGLKQLFDAIVERMGEIEAEGKRELGTDLTFAITMLNPLGSSAKTYYTLQNRQRINRSTLGGIDTAMWWEQGSAADVYRGLAPRPKPPRTPFQLLIALSRARRERSLARIAELSGGRISQSQVHRLENEPIPKSGISDEHISALAEGLAIPEATIREAIDRSTTRRTSSPPAYSHEVRVVADRLEELPPAIRVRAAQSAEQVITAFLAIIPPWARNEGMDPRAALTTLWDAWHGATSLDEFAEMADRAAKLAGEPLTGGPDDVSSRRELDET